MTPLVLFESFVTNLLLGLSTKRKKKKCSLADSYRSGPYGVTKYGSG